MMTLGFGNGSSRSVSHHGGGHFCPPMNNVVARPPKPAAFYRRVADHVWCLLCGKGQDSRRGLSVVGVNDRSIDVLELLRMVVGAWLLVIQQRHVSMDAGR